MTPIVVLLLIVLAGGSALVGWALYGMAHAPIHRRVVKNAYRAGILDRDRDHSDEPTGV